jgi:hypothetical protein
MVSLSLGMALVKGTSVHHRLVGWFKRAGCEKAFSRTQAGESSGSKPSGTFRATRSRDFIIWAFL